MKEHKKIKPYSDKELKQVKKDLEKITCKHSTHHSFCSCGIYRLLATIDKLKE